MTQIERDRAQSLLADIVWEAFTRSKGDVAVLIMLLHRRVELETLLDAQVKP